MGKSTSFPVCIAVGLPIRVTQCTKNGRFYGTIIYAEMSELYDRLLFLEFSDGYFIAHFRDGTHLWIGRTSFYCPSHKVLIERQIRFPFSLRESRSGLAEKRIGQQTLLSGKENKQFDSFKFFDSFRPMYWLSFWIWESGPLDLIRFQTVHIQKKRQQEGWGQTNVGLDLAKTVSTGKNIPTSGKIK